MNRWTVIKRIVQATLRREGPWGINASKVDCPRCGAVMPRIRRPRNERQYHWGGWTCPGCGIEMDKWGNRIANEE